MGLKTLADYINWKNEAVIKPDKPDFPHEWRPPVLPTMYDKPQTRLFSPLDSDPIMKRVLFNTKLPPPRVLPIVGTPGFQFFAGITSGFILTMVFTCKDLGRKEVQDLVMYDPAYFPEYAALRGNKA